MNFNVVRNLETIWNIYIYIFFCINSELIIKN